MSSQGLPVSRLINVSVVFTPVAAQAPNLNSALIVGSTNVIDVAERIRNYSGIEEVAADFGTNTPEYFAAVDFFSQKPQPNALYIGRWAEVATSGILYGGILTPTQQLIATWQAIVAGNFKINLNGAGATNIVCGTFAGAANLNAVAVIIQTAVRAIGGGGFAAATVVWNGSQFIFTSGTTGVASTVGALTAGVANDISAMLKGTAGTLSKIVGGVNAETPVQAVVILDNQKVYWYLMDFASTTITDDQSMAVAAYIEAAANKHLFGITSQDPECLDPASSTDIMARTSAANFDRTFVQYSSVDPYAISSWLGRAVTVNFAGSATVITMMYKQEPGVIAESLSTTQADTLRSKNGNVFANYNNGTAIIEYGTVASGSYFDDIQDTDWLAYTIQNSVFNLLYTSGSKIPQTDAGNHLILNAIEAACAQGVVNGTLAPGQWNANGFGQLKQGDYLSKGYYIYAPPVASQSQADREARKSVPFQVAAKLAGAVHTVDITLNINR